jgi:hypothetical protein
MIHNPDENIIVRFGELELSANAEVLMLTYLQSLKYKTEAIAPAAAPLAPPRIATEWPGQGGVYAGIMRGEDGLPDYHLIVPTHSSASIKKIIWSDSYIDQPIANHEFDGLANTTALCKSAYSHPAAQWAASLKIDGLSDFYLPARRELSLAFATVPELFEKEWHWSSTQYAAHPGYAWLQDFTNGNQGYLPKSNEYRARPVRRILIIQ